MRLAFITLLVLVLPIHAEDLGLKVPPGFRVTLWADHNLANDIFTMALDEKGRVVVSGPGYIRRLEDTKGEGRADKATDIAETKTGAMGLLHAYDRIEQQFDLFTAADGRIRGFSRRDDTVPYVSYRLNALDSYPFSEHGGHALKVGPDGAMYSIAGNDAKLSQLKTTRDSPVRAAEGGGILRFSEPIRFEPTIFAHGFRNPYDFDFTAYGDIITWDSDTERDDGLPWYSPTRVYHVMPGAHHGWRLPGYMRSLARPDYYTDTVEVLADMGRGSPTGVCCYRHTQFPAHYRGGVFLCDWTFGRIYYMPLIPEGSSYKKIKPELFLEATGTNGFAPTAIRVGPDGSLFVSIGGRGTRGVVYRIEYLVNGEHPVIPKAEPESELDQVLDAPQPLEAWSMAKWLQLAEKLDESALERIALDELAPDMRRIRAIDIWMTRTSYWYGIDALGRSKSETVRARVASSLISTSGAGSLTLLWSLARDDSPRVRVNALLSIASRLIANANSIIDQRALLGNLAHPDHRVRLAAAHLLALLPEREEMRIERQILLSESPRAVVSMVVTHTLPGHTFSRQTREYLNDAIHAFERAKSSADRVDAIRAIVLTLGDWNLSAPKVELFSAYSLPPSSKADAAYIRLVVHSFIGKLLEHFPSTDPHENTEISRLVAMLEVDDPEAFRKVLSQITEVSHPTQDFHYLTVLSRLSGRRNLNQKRDIADALVALDKKLAKRNVQVKQNWPARFSELVGELLSANPELQEMLATHPDLTRPGNILIAVKLTGDNRKQAATRFLATVRDNAEFPLSADLIDLLAKLPADDVLPVIRTRWSDRSARELLVKYLAEKPIPADRGKFLEILEVASGESLNAALSGLEKLPRDQSPANLVPLFARLRQSLSDPKEASIRKRLVALINRQAGQMFSVTETKTDSPTLAAAYGPLFTWFEREHSELAKKLTTAGEDEEAIRKLFPSVKWQAGDVERGRKVYRDRGCQTCHGGTTRIGPDLASVSKRFSREDLLTAIVNPSRDVAPAYRVTNIETKDGKRISGIIIYESTETLLLQTGAAETKRIAGGDIESRTPSAKSLMPDGLLKGIKSEELADLFAFLASQ
jgi:putative heme-binding domain-containing protein